VRAAAFAVLVLACACARGQTIGIDLGSHHFVAKKVTDQNYGLYFEHEGWAGGAYRNSFRRTSVWAGRVIDVGPVDVTIGLSTGYEGRRSPLFILPSAKFGPVRVSATHRLIHLSIEYKL
jgi:hypothetical protein